MQRVYRVKQQDEQGHQITDHVTATSARQAVSLARQHMPGLKLDRVERLSKDSPWVVESVFEPRPSGEL